jgi:hypothetical protein
MQLKLYTSLIVVISIECFRFDKISISVIGPHVCKIYWSWEKLKDHGNLGGNVNKSNMCLHVHGCRGLRSLIYTSLHTQTPVLCYYFLNSIQCIASSEADICLVGQEFTRPLRNPNVYIAVFTSVRHCLLSRAGLIQSSRSYLTYLRTISIVLCHCRPPEPQTGYSR